MKDDSPRAAEQLYEAYLLKHPRHISDLFFVLEVKRERKEVTS